MAEQSCPLPCNPGLLGAHAIPSRPVAASVPGGSPFVRRQDRRKPVQFVSPWSARTIIGDVRYKPQRPPNLDQDTDDPALFRWFVSWKIALVRCTRKHAMVRGWLKRRTSLSIDAVFWPRQGSSTASGKKTPAGPWRSAWRAVVCLIARRFDDGFGSWPIDVSARKRGGFRGSTCRHVDRGPRPARAMCHERTLQRPGDTTLKCHTATRSGQK